MPQMELFPDVFALKYVNGCEFTMTEGTAGMHVPYVREWEYVAGTNSVVTLVTLGSAIIVQII